MAIKAVIIGVGILGTRVLDRLIKCKIKPEVIDRDIVQERNLRMQLFYTKKDIGKPKAEIIRELFNLKGYISDLNYKNISLLRSSLAIDCSDNLHTRFLINDYCRKKDINAVFAAVTGNHGFVFPLTANGACLRCILRHPKNLETCETAGVDLAVADFVADMQFKIIRQMLANKKPANKKSKQSLFLITKTSSGKITIRAIAVKRKRSCPACNGRYEYLAGKGEDIVKFCGNNLYQIKGQFSLKALKGRWKQFAEKYSSDYISFAPKSGEIFLFKDRALIKAENIREAKAIFSRYIGD